MNDVSHDDSYRVTADELRQFVERFERLEADLDRVFVLLGLDRRPLTRSKSMQRQGSYRDWYGKSERGQVERLFANELRQFKYGF